MHATADDGDDDAARSGSTADVGAPSSAATALATNPIWLSIVGAAGLLVLGFAWLLLPLDVWMQQFSAWLNSFGAAGVVGFVVFYAFATLILVPGTPMSIAAGIAYGWWGVPVVMAAALASAIAAFLLSRYLARAHVEGVLHNRRRLRAAEAAVNEDGWKVVALVRMSPVIPFAAQNYFFGVTGVSFLTYVVVSTLALIPGAILHVYVGVLGQAAADSGTTVLNWAFLIVGIIATVAVTVLVGRKTRAKLREHGARD